LYFIELYYYYNFQRGRDRQTDRQTETYNENRTASNMFKRKDQLSRGT